MRQEEIIKVVQYLIENNIHLTANYEPIGAPFFLKVEDVTRYLEDKDAFFAAECGVSKIDYLDWKSFVKAGCICSAVNKKGKRCSKKIQDCDELSPMVFIRRRKKNRLKCKVHAI